MLNRLFEYLIENGIEVYFIGQKSGECTSNYVVLKNNGIDAENNKVGRGLIDILFYVPVDYPATCEDYKLKVKRILKNFKGIRYAGSETGEVVDEEKKAITFSVMYEIFKKLEG